MKILALSALLSGAAALGGCVTEPAARVGTVATAGPCSSSGYVDVNNDGWISGDEWNTWRSRGYAAWDSNHDGRVSRVEFERCYRAGGFYRDTYYKPDYWTNYWTAFDTDNDGYLSADEYWATSVYDRADRNHNGRIDADEYVWWNATP